MAPSPLDKQTVGCNLPHNWLISLSMDLAICVICGGKCGTKGHHLAVFSLDIAFAYHFMASCLPSNLPPYRSAHGIGYASKKLSKMVGKSAIIAIHSIFGESMDYIYL